MRDSKIMTYDSILNQPIQLLAFADAIVIFCRTSCPMKETFTALKNGAKTKESLKPKMRIKPQNQGAPRQNFTINSYNIEAVDEFVYLGVLIQLVAAHYMKSSKEFFHEEYQEG